MNSLDLDALEELEKKVKPGDWDADRLFDVWPITRDTADLIAAARNALPELIRLARIGQKVEGQR